MEIAAGLCSDAVVIYSMQVILLEDVEKLGSQGELMSVPVGFWRNYLQPNAIAKVASERILE